MQKKRKTATRAVRSQGLPRAGRVRVRRSSFRQQVHNAASERMRWSRRSHRRKRERRHGGHDEWTGDGQYKVKGKPPPSPTRNPAKTPPLVGGEGRARGNRRKARKFSRGVEEMMNERGLVGHHHQSGVRSPYLRRTGRAGSTNLQLDGLSDPTIPSYCTAGKDILMGGSFWALRPHSPEHRKQQGRTSSWEAPFGLCNPTPPSTGNAPRIL